MTAKRWNLLRAAGIGLVVGMAYSGLRGFIDQPSAEIAYRLGEVAGGAIGGAVLFGLVAGTRNLILRAK